MNNNPINDYQNEKDNLELELAEQELKGKLRLFWIFSCTAGPILGWFAVSYWTTLTEENWQRLYTTRLLFGVALPLVSALFLIFYPKRKSKYLAAILFVTTIPAISCYWTTKDLINGAMTRSGVYESFDCGVYRCCWLNAGINTYTLPCNLGRNKEQMTVTYLPNTQRVLKVNQVSST